MVSGRIVQKTRHVVIENQESTLGLKISTVGLEVMNHIPACPYHVIIQDCQ
jgi:hypothetical protein